MKNLALAFLMIIFRGIQAQNMPKQKTLKVQSHKSVLEPHKKINDSVPNLIPIKKEGKYGFQDQFGNVKIKPEYILVAFFAEDCMLQNSPNKNVRKFGSSDYASASLEKDDFRIDKFGKRVYQFKKEDLGKCSIIFKKQRYQAYILNEKYGIIETDKFLDAADWRQFRIYPQFEYLHVMEGDDVNDPMIVAAKDDKFGVINVHGKVLIPFEYANIKRNFSWKLGRLFEVTKDGTNYYFVDINNHAY